MEVVTRVASSVVAKILEYPVRHIGRHLGYLIYYQTNKKSLTDRVLELGNKISSVQRSADAAGRNGEQLEECVTDWIKKAEGKFQEAKAVIEDRGHENAKCSCNGSFPNLVSRYKLSKEAKILAEKIVIDLREVDDFRKFSYRPHIQPSFKNKDFETFVSRTKTLEEIMEALRDPNLTMIGVYGMGGVGKTTLVNEVARQAKEEECFSDVVMVTVSQDVDLKSIQNRIAEWLGLTLDGEDMLRRANRLRDRLTQEKKILIILDDIWGEVDLLKVGINFEAGDQKGCKILLVSRDRDVLCSLMDVTKIIEVKVLSDREAEGLFNKFVGDKADNSDFKELANQVVGECGGLPIAIVTIARSLKNKDILFWKDFLYRLQSSRGMEGKVYTSIKMSYDVLQSEEEKKLLLLCSLHGEDANVRVNDLMFYGIGLHLFQGVHTMEVARCRAHSLVDKLKARCLLMDGDVYYKGTTIKMYDRGTTVKMHDVIRDVMISIANEDEHMHCLTKVADLENGDFRESKAIVLLGSDFNDQLPPSLVCPNLQLLLAFDSYDVLFLETIPDDFFKEAQELKALSFDCEPLESLPQSFCTLQHLRALRLRLDKNEDLTLIGELRNLIALDLSGSTFSQLTEHIGKLTRLRSLNLSDCESLSVIQPNVISSLVRLEELYMDEVNIDWEVEGRVGEGRNASLMEFKNLRNLTALHLNVRDADALPNDMFSANLQRFRIMIGSRRTYAGDFTGSVPNDMFSANLQRFRIMIGSRRTYAGDFTGSVPNDMFTCSLVVSNCRNLKNLFTVALAGRLEQLEKLSINGCPVMEEVVVTNEHGEERSEKLFPKLKSLELEDLPNLKRFCTGDCIECPSLLKLKIKNCGVLRKFISNNEEEVEGPFFNEKVVFPSLKELVLFRMNFREIWSTTSCMQNLRELYVSNCPNLKYLFTVMAGRLEQLENLSINGCPVMEEVVFTNERREEILEKILLPKLKHLKLENLPNLKRFCTGDCIEYPSLLKLEIENCGVLRKFISSNEEEVEGPFFNEKVSFPILEDLRLSRMNLKILWADQLSITSFGMPNLKRLYVFSCDSLSHLFSLDVARSLLQLEELQLENCKDTEEVLVTKEPIEEETPQKILFPKLKNLELRNVENIRRFCVGCCIEFPSLTNMKIQGGNPAMITDSCNGASGELMGFEARQPFFNGKVAFPKLEKLEVHCLNSVNSLFSFAVAKSLITLKNLEVWVCSRMEEIVQVNEQGRLDKISFPKLKRIHFMGLSNLKRFYDKSEELMGSEAKQPLFNGTVAFPKLEELIVLSLINVNSLFSFAVANSLETLKSLQVWWCHLMEEIVQVNEQGEEGRLDKISFPKLESIEFQGLSNLKRFYEKSKELMGSEAKQPLFNETVAFPKLETLNVSHLNSVNSLFSFAVANSLETLKKLGVSWCSLMEEIVQVKEQEEEERLGKISFPKLKSIDFDGLSNLKRFYGGACIEFPSLLKLGRRTVKETEEIMDKVVLGPNLEELRTSSSKLIKETCNCQSSRAPPFCNLKDAQLKCFRNEPIGFSLKCIQRYQNLESLSLSGFFVDATHHHQQLMVSSEEHERPLKHLKKLRLSQLSMLTHLYEDSEDSENSSLESLKFLHIQECNRLKSPLLSSMTSFQNLMALVVSKCSAMINLLASSTAKTLVHLRLMSITECKQMTEIIEDEIVDDEIVFGKLEILELSDLPSLRSFHSAGNSVMRFPNLVMLVVSQCPEMRRFSFGTIDAPKLDSISEIKKNKHRWYWLSESNFNSEMSRLPEPQKKLWEGDINKTLEKLWEEDYSLAMQRLFTDT